MRSVDNNRCLVMHGRASCDNVYIILQRLCTFASILLIWLPIALVYKEKVATTNWYHLRDGPGTSSSRLSYHLETLLVHLHDICSKSLVKRTILDRSLLEGTSNERAKEGVQVLVHFDGLASLGGSGNAPAVEPCTRSVKDAPLLYRQQEGWETFKMETAKK